MHKSKLIIIAAVSILISAAAAFIGWILFSNYRILPTMATSESEKQNRLENTETTKENEGYLALHYISTDKFYEETSEIQLDEQTMQKVLNIIDNIEGGSLTQETVKQLKELGLSYMQIEMLSNLRSVECDSLHLPASDVPSSGSVLQSEDNH